MSKQLRFRDLTFLFSKLESTSSSLAMIDLLSDFFKTIRPEDARIAARFIRGEVAPSYAGVEIGLARKLVMKVIAHAASVSEKEVNTRFIKSGDLGAVVGSLLKESRGRGLTADEVFERIYQIASFSGRGSQEHKISELSSLLKECSPTEALYLVRLVLGTLRLGVGEMTFLSGLSQALTGTRANKKKFEEHFNVLSDLGEVAYEAVKYRGKNLGRAKPSVGVPVRMMLAQRVEKLEEVGEHIGGEVFVEYKYDGERIQAHIKNRDEIILFSRRHENITYQYPDLIEALRRSFKGKNAIVEGEIVPIDTESGKLLDFQTLMQRRRKYDIENYVAKIPVRYFLFDLIYFNGQSFLARPLVARKKEIKKYFIETSAIAYAKSIITSEPAEIESFFSEATNLGGEGIMIKDAQSSYEAGKRGWRWIKFKKDYEAALADTFDLAVVGGLHGRGRRAGSYGSLLLAAFDPKTNRYYSFTKVGAGFTDEDLKNIPRRLNKNKIKEKHRLVETDMEADVWFEPSLVIEVSGADITISPVHTVAADKIKKGGLALRFPRFLRFRDDKRPEQATSVEEIYGLYKNSKRQPN